AKELFGLISANSEQRDRAARGPQQARHQIHQRRLPCSVWTDETRDARRDLQVDAVHSEYLAVELGDVIEDDELISRNRHRTYRTTSYAFTRHDKIARQTAQITNSAAHEHHNGGSSI